MSLGTTRTALQSNAAIAEGVITRALSPELDDLDDTEAVVIAVYGDAAVDILTRLATIR